MKNTKNTIFILSDAFLFIGIITALISFILLIKAIGLLSLSQFDYSVLSFMISFISYAAFVKSRMIYDAMSQKKSR